MMKATFWSMAMALTLVSGAGTVLGQQQDQRRGFDPERMREQMTERMKTQLKVGDEDWKLIQPLLENVVTKQRDSAVGRFGGMMMMGRQRPPGGEAQAQGQSQGQSQGQGQRAEGRRDRGFGGRGGGSPELEALRTSLEAENPSAADVKAKLAAVRESRKKSETELKAAREELRKVLTLQQEAQLVLMGILD